MKEVNPGAPGSGEWAQGRRRPAACDGSCGGEGSRGGRFGGHVRVSSRRAQPAKPSPLVLLCPLCRLGQQGGAGLHRKPSGERVPAPLLVHVLPASVSAAPTSWPPPERSGHFVVLPCLHACRPAARCTRLPAPATRWHLLACFHPTHCSCPPSLGFATFYLWRSPDLQIFYLHIWPANCVQDPSGFDCAGPASRPYSPRLPRPCSCPP